MKRTHKNFKGKRYTSYGSYKNKNIPYREAKNLRKEGWNARVVKEGKWYTVYKRKTKRTLKWSVKDHRDWERSH